MRSSPIPFDQFIQIDCSAVQPTPHPNASPTIRNINPTRPTTQPASPNRATCSRTTADQQAPSKHPPIHRAHIDHTPDRKTEKAPKASKQASPASPRQIPPQNVQKLFKGLTIRKVKEDNPHRTSFEDERENTRVPMHSGYQ